MRIGIDIVEVPRFQAFLSRRGERALLRLFTPEELAYAQRGEGELFVQRLAARFAAKEAFCKALGRGVPFREIQILAGENGPRLLWRGQEFPVSLSHTAAFAAAVVLIPSQARATSPAG
ncbi:MAG: holo-ACP synthase [Candidatus Bipolaricaulota bacterium]|nr:holo-ACP synthase [Candidatus Bipolaricaulota bacterium]MDW8126221.1 holo-ACP synthase [Candidatus Bipolaricaulota bacterium]